MKACPEYQKKDWESTHSFKKGAFRVEGIPFQDKKEKELGKEKGKPLWGVVSLVIFSVIVGGLLFCLAPGDSKADPRTSSPPPAAGKMDSTGQAIRMTDIIAKVENGKISIPLDVVKEKKIVRFEYETNGVRIPLLSYMTPRGKVVTAISVCEPCRSTKFHIKDNSMVCNACFAEWDLETLRGIKGGCLDYPPDVIPNKVEKGQILIDEKIVTHWKPRV